MNENKRVDNLLKELERYGVDDIRFSGNNPATLEDYDVIVDSLKEMEKIFPSFDELKKELG